MSTGGQEVCGKGSHPRRIVVSTEVKGARWAEGQWAGKGGRASGSTRLDRKGMERHGIGTVQLLETSKDRSGWDSLVVEKTS